MHDHRSPQSHLFSSIRFYSSSFIHETGAEAKCDCCSHNALALVFLGYYRAANYNGLCQACPMGSYANSLGSTVCTSCESGFDTRMNLHSTAADACQACPLNQIIVKSTAVSTDGNRQCANSPCAVATGQWDAIA